ncbi:MAG TPA: proteasome subunit alpha [Candidatus Binatia bacterium]|jgi:proteasome alpha subunit|nr:proteasome subunit alpha [Candidatus Binatia bacterium]
MPLPYYVSPEQMMKDKAEYARKGISRGRAIVAIEYRDGILLVAENPSTLLHKISEIYDRIAFAGVGKYNEFENLRVAGVRLADIKGYSYSRGDVSAKALANAYSQGLGNIFTQDIKPFEVELLVCEVSEQNGSKNEIYHILYDGTIEDERNYAAMGGQSEDIRRYLKDNFQEALDLATAFQLGVRALMVTQNKTLTERDLEVAVLDRTKARRKFRRIPPEAVHQMLAGLP